MHHAGGFCVLTFSLHDTKESTKILSHLFCVEKQKLHGMCTEEIIRPCETYEICEYSSLFIIILIRFASQLTGNMERFHVALLVPFKQYAVYLFLLSPSPSKYTNDMPSCCPGTVYISHEGTCEENKIPLLILQKAENGSGFRK